MNGLIHHNAPPKDDLPRVAVLMTTYNGQSWLAEQLQSILTQTGVSTCLFISDDFSTDQTPDLLEQAAHQHGNIRIMPPPARCGNAGRNFYHLIANVDLGHVDHVAFADQDDVWMPDKLQRAIRMIEQHAACGYSSNFWAWYPQKTANRQRVLINKAQPQQKWDHWFQGPGPGCTFVLTRDLFCDLQQFVRKRRSEVDQIQYHDWLMYAFARERRQSWWIDSQPTLLYRQHAHNEIGVSRGWSALRKRFRLLNNGWYSQQILDLAHLLDALPIWPLQALEHMHWQDRIRLIWHVRHFRRGWRDRLALAVAFLFILPARHAPHSRAATTPLLGTMSDLTPPPPSAPRHQDVFAVVVAYNPPTEALTRLLDAVHPQAGQVIVVDNGSRDELASLTIKPAWNNVRIHRNGKNLGIGGAHNVGFGLAADGGARYVLLLDQDSVPAPDMVHQLYTAMTELQATGEPIASVGARYVDKRLNNKPPFVRIEYCMRWRQYPRHANDRVKVDYLIASGSLTPVDVIQKVGGMQADMFMDYLDLEWGMRAKCHGYQCYGIYAAKMEHEIGQEPVRFLGKKFMVHSVSGHYYMARNAMWLYRQPHIPLQWKIFDGVWLVCRIGFYSLLAKQGGTHFSAMMRGLSHGLSGKLGPLEHAGHQK